MNRYSTEYIRWLWKEFTRQAKATTRCNF